MTGTPRILVIGAGIAGIACAAALARAGLSPSIVDKGRGIGGRLATRRHTDGWAWDHGAPLVTAQRAPFAGALADACAAGAAARWTDGVVGLPGMTGLVRHMAAGLHVEQGVEVTAISREPAGWRVSAEGWQGRYDAVICTAPAPQARRLFAHDPDLMAPLADVAFDPCWALLLAFETPPDWSDIGPSDDTIARLARDGAKPRRQGRACWVAHATPAWTRAHLEDDRQAVAGALLAHLSDRVGTPPPPAVLSAHRWRFARVARPLGQPFLASPDRSAYLGGDWCLGPEAEHAFDSGSAIAADLLATYSPAIGAAR